MASGTLGILNDGMVIISGTGSICLATKTGDEFARTGGWG
jgi:N-acetylglucosamine kinase-like BadF-type ATPase